MAEKIKNDLFSVQEAAEFLGISKSTIYRYISDGRLSAYRLGQKRLIRIKRQDLDKLLIPINPSEGENS